MSGGDATKHPEFENAVAPAIPITGPEPTLRDEIRALHARMLGVAET